MTNVFLLQSPDIRKPPAQSAVVPMSLDVKQAVAAALESTEPSQLDTVAIHAKIRRLEVQVEELAALVRSFLQPAPTNPVVIEEQWVPQSQVATELNINTQRFARWEMRGVLTRQDRDGVPHVLRSQVEACLKMKRMPPCSADKQVVACAKVGMSLNEVGELVGHYGDSVRAVLERLGYKLARKFNRETGRSYSYIAALPSSVEEQS